MRATGFPRLLMLAHSAALTYSLFCLPTVSDLRAQVGLGQFSITHLVSVIHYESDWSCDIDQNPPVTAAVGH